jgi:hypothetical protein
VMGPGAVVEVLGSGLPVAPPPRAEPDRGAAAAGAAGLDGPAGVAPGKGSRTRRALVVPG